MFQVPKVSGILNPGGVSGILNPGGHSQNRIKGTVVLMRKNVLDFNSVADFTKGNVGGVIGTGLSVVGSTVDGLTAFLGRSVSLQLISATKSDESGKGKVGKDTFIEGIITSLPTLGAGESAFYVHFEWDESMGIPGAFYVKNFMQVEFYLKSLTLEDVPNHGTIRFVCNSWIYNTNLYKKSLRIFFANHVHSNCEKPGEVYVPRDENFGHLKSSDFLAYGIKSLSQYVLPAFESMFSLNLTPNEFDSFQDVRDLCEGGIKLPTEVISSIALLPVIKELFRTDGEQVLKFPTPHVIKVNKSAWMTDEEFAREMIAGVNPNVIRGLEEFPPKSNLDPATYGDQNSKITAEALDLEGSTVDEALAKKRLFVLDYHDIFMPYIRGINQTYAKAYATRTILFLKENGTLMPVAIELSLPHPAGDKSGAVSQVILPAKEGVESTIWLLAKAYVVVNDSCYHQLMSHWLNTHAVMEPFIIATHRHLSALHPIYKLLTPHYRDTMNINALARQSLINADGIIEKSFLPSKYSVEMSSAVYKNWVFTDQALPAELVKRGVAVKDSSAPHGLRLLIEDYPYAVDGLEIWAVIKSWVQEYVSLYYAKDDDVKSDPELQHWWKEAVEKGHADLKDKPWWPKLQTLEELVEICTIIIWTGSALHAAVNFGQYPYGGFILNRPTSSRRLLPEKGTPEYEEMVNSHQKAYLRTITSKFQTMIDLSVIEILSRHASDEVYLGQRENPHWTSDSKALQAFQKFGNKLKDIEEKLASKNKDEKLRNRIGPVELPYTLLHPTSEEGLTFRGIPNSISI
ncbi:Seed linoleate 9S-lipoxygenase-2 [Vigna angularis]|uniref:Lipoxygenase n=1 Tax=Phaseolus angularis TaxID=3914 RepID=A0A8T0JFY0_PHAAN|nr:Seed linoleate 9S-lipoxygenase-2 [Vigna angularis]